jgi:hypothetical protein
MYVSHAYRLVYLSPPKTGTSSIANLFQASPFNATIPKGHRTQHDVEWYEGFRSFISVRHPYVRAFSFWRFSCYQAISTIRNEQSISWRRTYAQGLPSLAGFLTHPHLEQNLKTIWRCSWHAEQWIEPINYVVRQEHFNKDLALIPEFKLLQFPWYNKNVASRTPWHYSFEQDPRCTQLVQDIWGEDFTRFGYTTDVSRCKEEFWFDAIDSHLGDPID